MKLNRGQENWYNALTVSTAKFLLPIIGAHLLFVYVGVRTFLVAFGDPEKTPRYMVLSALGNVLASLVTVVVMYSVKTVQKDPEIVAELWKSIALGALAIFYTCFSKQVRKTFLGGKRLNLKTL